MLHEDVSGLDAYPVPDAAPAAPRNLEVEQSLLGAILWDNAQMHAVSSFLEPDHFHEHLHARIYNAARLEIDHGRPVSPITLIHRFADDVGMKELGGAAKYFAHLAAGAITTCNAPHYGRIIYELAQRRRVIEVAAELKERASGDMVQNVEDISSEAVTMITNGTGIAEDRLKRTRYSFSEAAYQVLGRVNDARMEGRPAIEVIQTGFTDLDRRIAGGLRRKQVCVAGGRTSMGKTTFAVAVSLNVARQGRGILYCSLEMGRDAMVYRMLANLSYGLGQAPIEHERIPRLDGITDHEMERLLDARSRFDNMPLIIEEKPSLAIAAIRGIAMREAERLAVTGRSLDLIVIDHIGKVAPTREYPGNPVAQLAETSNQITALAKDLNCAILSLSQLTREIEKRESHRPTTADFKWSGAIEDDADITLLLYREAYYLERKIADAKGNQKIEAEDRLAEVKNELEIIIGKSREGKIGTVKAFCDMGSCVVRDKEWRR